MKTVLTLTLAVIAASLSAATLAAGEHEGHGAMHAASPSPASTAMADGLILKVDKPGGKLKISHGPLPNGMGAMTMDFRVKDAAWLDQLKEGERIRFAIDTINGAMTVVRFERVK